MPARKNKLSLSEAWRERIKTGVIMQRIEQHIMGNLDLSSTQIAAAKLLLGKIVPDLNRTELAGDPNKPIAHKVTVEVVSGKLNAE